MIADGFIVFAIAFLACLVFTTVIIKFCRKYSIYDNPGGRHKRHKKPTPILGGTAILISVWVAIFSFLIFGDGAFTDIKGALPHILIGSLMIYGIGLLDDFRPVSAWAKLTAQAAAGLVLYFGGLSVNLISLPILGEFGVNGFSFFITVGWVIALSNAINLIDGLDGLAAGVSVIASVTMVIIGVLFKIDAMIIISVAVLGSLLAFWIFNRYPARIFLGDSGSLLIGYFFAVISLVVPIKSYTTAALFMPLVVLGVPLTEVITSFLRRLAAGKSVMRADRRHIFHLLAFAGLSYRQIINLFYLSGLFFGFLSIIMLLFGRGVVLAFLLLFMVVIFIIYFILIARMKKENTA
ncbi:MAG: undecaprenyl/decaprenyl-phosphate alpha-N-acetylglucosaminyl 1-phosphate transferase [Candidatus Zixiibacteriota bacterium]|nr:MAG: undecaprenyl/decaprenyl-phosphate alpha-N-acetylglucosaminyl 1-phosphate transferase [candidate division Zixibacteria bacterium]